MAAMPWMQSVRNTGQLTVHNGVARGKWSGVFKPAITTFNSIVKAGVKLVETNDENAANIVTQLSDGKSQFTYDGNIATAQFNATMAAGITLIFSRDGAVEKAAVFLPREPKESHANVLLFIAVHEFIHACGLDDDEHAGDGVFMTSPNIQGGKLWAQKGSKKMPPLFLAPKTVTKLQSIW